MLMIVGRDILARGLIQGGDECNLKHSTYNLTIGEIVPIGKSAVQDRINGRGLKAYFLEPREMVWILSEETFCMPSNVTGLATLRTSLTKEGILALNVGIIDPMFSGPISTALINFSDRPRRIGVGDRFFRVVFIEHDDVSDFHEKNENTERAEYLKNLETASYNDFSKNFLNVPEFNDDFYFRKFWRIVWHGISQEKLIWWPFLAFIGMVLWFLFDRGFVGFVYGKAEGIARILSPLKFW